MTTEYRNFVDYMEAAGGEEIAVLDGYFDLKQLRAITQTLEKKNNVEENKSAQDTAVDAVSTPQEEVVEQNLLAEYAKVKTEVIAFIERGNIVAGISHLLNWVEDTLHGAHAAAAAEGAEEKAPEPDKQA